jgi:hypothetical protein
VVGELLSKATAMMVGSSTEWNFMVLQNQLKQIKPGGAAAVM